MTVQLTHYLADLLKGGDNHKTITKELAEDIPTKQADYRVNQLLDGVLSFEPFESKEPKDINSKTQSPPLVLSCGIHGNETAPIEIVDDLLKDLSLGNLTLKRPLLIIFGHIKAMLNQTRFIDFNLNRLFSGFHERFPEAIESSRAKELEDVVADFFHRYGKGLHLDLHTAIRPSHLKRFAIYPTHENSMPLDSEIEFLKAMGIEGLLLSNESAATFSAFSARECQSQAFTLELGKVEPFGKNIRADFLAAHQTLENLIEAKADLITESSKKKELKVFRVVHEMIRENEDYIFHVPEDYANFTPLKEGTPLETTSSGTLNAKEGQAVVFPNSQVKVGQRSGLVIEEAKTI